MTQNKRTASKSNIKRSWQAHIDAQEKSGLSRAAYCRVQDLSYHALTYWSRKLSRPSQSRTKLVPVPVESIMRMNKTADQPSGMKIVVSDHVAIEINEQFSSTALNKILSVLEGQ
jgi:hypothetical protein